LAAVYFNPVVSCQFLYREARERKEGKKQRKVENKERERVKKKRKMKDRIRIKGTKEGNKTREGR
jgi:hypothetical protein